MPELFDVNIQSQTISANGLVFNFPSVSGTFALLGDIASATGDITGGLTQLDSRFVNVTGDTIFGNLIIDSGANSNSGLKLNRISSNTTENSIYSGVLGVDASGNVGIAPVDVALFSPALVYWDGINDPTSGSHAYPMPVMAGTATFIDSTNGVRLTPALNNVAGSLVWDFTQIIFERIQFKYKAGGGTGADAVWFFGYTDGIPTTEYGTGITKGYILALSEFHDAVTIGWGSGSDWINNTVGYGNSLQVSPSIILDDNQWHDVDMVILDNKVVIKYDGVEIINFSDIYGRDRTATKFGFGSRTGSQNNNHFIKGLLVTKLGMNPADYGIIEHDFIYSEPATTARNVIKPAIPAVTPLSIQCISGQSADLIQWLDKDGGLLSKIRTNGNFTGDVDYIPSISGNWIIQPATLDTALDELAMNWFSNRRIVLQDDFVYGAIITTTPQGPAGLIASNTGTGAAITMVTSTAGHCGVVQYSTGTTASGRSGISLGTNTIMPSGTFIIETYVMFPTLSVVAQEYAFISGLTDVVTKTPNNGAYFVYDRLLYGNFWGFGTAAGGTRAVTTSAVAIVANTWYKLKIAAYLTGTKDVDFYVNDVLIGTLTGNIPTLVTGIQSFMLKSAGTTASTMQCDYLNIAMDIPAR
jgi:hypothetical protein